MTMPLRGSPGEGPLQLVPSAAEVAAAGHSRVAEGTHELPWAVLIGYNNYDMDKE